MEKTLYLKLRDLITSRINDNFNREYLYINFTDCCGFNSITIFIGTQYFTCGIDEAIESDKYLAISIVLSVPHKVRVEFRIRGDEACNDHVTISSNNKYCNSIKDLLIERVDEDLLELLCEIGESFYHRLINLFEPISLNIPKRAE
jgi:hypothetical protein